MNNFGLKLISLTLAIIFSFVVHYFFVQSDSRVSVLQIIAPVEIGNLPADRIVISPAIRQAEVTLQGSPNRLSLIASKPPLFSIQIPQDAPNKITVPLRNADLIVPPFVEILSIKPTELELTLDNRVSKSVSVTVPRIGSLPDTLKLESIKVTPDKVEMNGPESVLKGIQSLQTNPIDYREIHGPTNVELELRYPEALRDAQPRKVSVEITVTSLVVEKSYVSVPVEVRSMPGMTYMVEPRVVNIKLSGTKEALNALGTEEVIPYVRMQRNGQSEKNQKVSLDVTKGVTVVNIEPATVDLTPMSPPGGSQSKAGTGTNKKGKP